MKVINKKAKLVLSAIYFIAFFGVIIQVVLLAILGEFHPFLNDTLFWDNLVIVIGAIIVFVNLFYMITSPRDIANVIVLFLGALYGLFYIWLSVYIFLGSIVMIPLVLICYKTK